MNRNPMDIPRLPYIDPETHTVFEANHAEAEGWLYKQSTWIKQWRRRYFILKNYYILFAKNEFSKPHGMIDLRDCTSVKTVDREGEEQKFQAASDEINQKNQYCIFEVKTKEERFLLCAESVSVKDDWIGSIGRAIVRYSQSYQIGDNDITGRKLFSGGLALRRNNILENTTALSSSYLQKTFKEQHDYDYHNEDFSNSSKHPYFND